MKAYQIFVKEIRNDFLQTYSDLNYEKNLNNYEEQAKKMAERWRDLSYMEKAEYELLAKKIFFISGE